MWQHSSRVQTGHESPPLKLTMGNPHQDQIGHGTQARASRISPRPVAQTFQSAGCGDFPVPTLTELEVPNSTELESSVNPQTGKSALRGVVPETPYTHRPHSC